jgi:hypothetical protein
MFTDNETIALLKARWDSLPAYLQVDNQVVGQHWVQCAFTMGPSYCSFGCSHCYLPGNANRVPLVSCADMKKQIDANREMIGKGGNIQITGGDVAEAYLRENRQDELIEIVDYAVQAGLVPMLMTHGQTLLDRPDFLAALVQDGGLRKLSIHIDITQAGRPGYPVKSLTDEAQLNPLRDQLVDLVLDTRKKTGCGLTAAQTVTVGSKNLGSIGSILEWLISSPRNMEVTRTISFQTEANVGRTLHQDSRIQPDEVWTEVCRTLGKEFPRDHLLFGHPDCTSTATILVRSSDRKVVSLSQQGKASQNFWQSLLTQHYGAGNVRENCVKMILINLCRTIYRPKLVWNLLQFVGDLYKNQSLTTAMVYAMLTGRAKGINIVMHNFIDAEEVIKPSCQKTRDRLAACSFRGAIERDGGWVAVPMCEVNAEIRPGLYSRKSEQSVAVSAVGLGME